MSGVQATYRPPEKSRGCLRLLDNPFFHAISRAQRRMGGAFFCCRQAPVPGGPFLKHFPDLPFSTITRIFRKTSGCSCFPSLAVRPHPPGGAALGHSWNPPSSERRCIKQPFFTASDFLFSGNAAAAPSSPLIFSGGKQYGVCCCCDKGI